MLPLALFSLLLTSQISAKPALPVQLDPDPAAVQPSLVFPTSAPPTTIPAFPEQSAATAGGAACPLDFSDDIIAGISASCSPRHRRPASRTRCCPSLAAGLYSAYASAALSAANSFRGNLPVLPDDSESCASAAERAIRGQGVELPRLNATCGTSYCYCGIRLRRLSCPLATEGGGGGGGGQGKWAPPESWARRLKKDCARPGLAGCSICLRTLNQLKGSAGDASSQNGKKERPRVNDCQLMGVTWLLSKDRRRYLPAATAVLRALMAAEEGASEGKVGATCRRTRGEMPIAVGSSEIDDDGYAENSAAGELPASLLLLMAAHSVLSVVL